LFFNTDFFVLKEQEPHHDKAWAPQKLIPCGSGSAKVFLYVYMKTHSGGAIMIFMVMFETRAAMSSVFGS
jgi:hypothetical protein